MRQHTRLADQAALGAPGPLPAVIETWTGDILLDLTGRVDPAQGMDGTGFWPVEVAPATTDPARQVLTGDITALQVDGPGKRWTATQAVRDMTAEEVRAAYLTAHPVPASVSDRQFFQQLAVQGDISQDEAIAYVTVGALPKVIADGIAKLPATMQFPARMAICGAHEFDRADPLVPTLGAILAKTSDQLDAIWRAAAQL